jgi:hypothetical protein
MAILFTQRIGIPISAAILAFGVGLASPSGIERQMWWLAGSGLVAAAVFVVLKSVFHRPVPAVLRAIGVRRREGVTLPAARFRRHRGRPVS